MINKLFKLKLIYLLILISASCTTNVTIEDGVSIVAPSTENPTPSPTQNTQIGFNSSTQHISENTGLISIQINLSRSLDTEVSLSLNVTGSAQMGTDYNLVSNIPLIFAAGETQKNFQLNLIDDDIAESTETIIINFTNLDNTLTSNSSTNSHTIHIADNDSAPQITSFSPSSNYLVAMPNSIDVTFSKNMSQTSVENAANWSYSCSGGGSAAILSVTLTGMTATVNILNVTPPSIGSTCSLEAKQTLVDLGNNSILGDLNNRTKVYTRADEPRVISVSSANSNGWYKTGDTIQIQVQMSEAIVVTGGNPQLVLETGTIDETVTLSSGSGTSQLSGSFIVQAGSNTNRLNYLNSSSFQLNGSSITSSTSGISLATTLPNLASAEALAQTKNIGIDTEAPTPPPSMNDGQFFNSSTTSPTIIYNAGTDSGSGIAYYQAQIINSSDDVLKSWSTFNSGETISGLNLINDNTYRVQFRSVDQAGNISTLVTSDGWIVDVSAPPQMGSLTLGSVPDSLSLSPTISWTNLNDVGLSGIANYQIQLRQNTSTIVDWTSFTSGSALSSLTLTAGLTYYVRVRAIDQAGNIGNYIDSAEWTANVFSCPANYIRVPAMAGYTTQDFCIAKYEMRNEGGVATSTPTGTPWVDIIRGTNNTSPNSAWKACKDLGSKYDLPTNNHWQTIARNIADQPQNWNTSIKNDGQLNRGHSDNSPANLIASSADDDQACHATGETCSSSVWNSQRRTHVLSNSQTLWDFAGNAWEWLQDNSSTNYGADSYATTFTSNPLLDLFGNDELCNSPGTSPFCGFGFGYLDYTNGGLYRGGGVQSYSYSGVFATALDYNVNSNNYGYLGFRCIYNP